MSSTIVHESNASSQENKVDTLLEQASGFSDFPHFFIVGVQRSGTTLLRLLLNAHSAIGIPQEAAFLMPFISKPQFTRSSPFPLREKENLVHYLQRNSQYERWRLNEQDLMQILEVDLPLRQIIGYLYYLAASKYGKAICGDKTPSFLRKLRTLSAAWPQAKFIHIVRDGRDVYLSLRHRRHYSVSSIALASLEWRFKLFLIQKALGKEWGKRAIELRYEDLVRDPEGYLDDVCAFLGVSFEREMLDFWKRSNEFVDRDQPDLITKPIDPSNIDKWREELSAVEVKKYVFFAGSTLKRYGYHVPDVQTTLSERMIFVGELISHLPRRMLRIANVALTMRLASKLGREVSLKYYK